MMEYLILWIINGFGFRCECCVVLPPTEGVITPSLLLKTTKKQYNIIISNYLYVFLKRKTHIEIQKKHIEIYLSFLFSIYVVVNH